MKTQAIKSEESAAETLRRLMADKLLSEIEAAEYMGIAPNTLNGWRCTGRYALKFIKVGRLVRYKLSDLEEFLERRTRSTGATA
jgi:excisionase family DNA binding protein